MFALNSVGRKFALKNNLNIFKALLHITTITGLVCEIDNIIYFEA